MARSIDLRYFWLQLKYHDSGKEKNCLPQVGQWNMMNKVCGLILQLSVHKQSWVQLFSLIFYKIKVNAVFSEVNMIRYFLFWFHLELSFDTGLFVSWWMIQKMINGMAVSRWACINFSRSVQDNIARTFCNELGQMCQVSGMVVSCLFYLLCLKIINL